MLFKGQKAIMRFCKQNGQAVIELAIFGAIIIFVIGLIFSQALSGSYFMNANLKAMRTALSESYKFSERGLSSRNGAGVTIIEDRLGGNLGGKFGPVDRAPISSSGSATMSKLLLYPVDYGETNALSTQDIFINGQRFPFTSSGWKTVQLPTAYDPSIIASCSGPHDDGMCWDFACTTTVLPPLLEDCTNGSDEFGTDPAVDCADPTCFGSWECPPGALGEDCTTAADDDADGFINCADRDCLDQPACNTSSGAGCVRLYRFVENVPGTDFDATNALYFDLDFDGIVDVAPADRANFAWQWQPVNAIFGTLGLETSVNVDGGGTLLPNGDHQTEVVKAISGCDQSVLNILNGQACELNCSTLTCDGLRITHLHVLDFQEGDIDGTRDDSSPPPDPGLLDDAQMFSYTRDGTFLRIEEGQLFNPADGRFVRHTNRTDHYDVIQRIFRVSNDTGRFCSAGGAPQGSVDGLTNPVEACNNCFSAANVERTCMDQAARLIYIRSRISNLGGRRWVTRKAPP